jgi:TolB protein
MQVGQVAYAQEEASFPELNALTPRSETYPVLSPDGRYVVYSSGEGFARNLYRLDVETRTVLQLTDNEFEDSAGAWSPDGSTIIFQREDEQGNRDIWQINADGDGARNLTMTPHIREQHPRFAPNGATIVFDSNHAETDEDGGADGIQNYEIYSLSLTTDSLTRLTDWDRWDMYPSFSPDMRHLVWRRALPTDQTDAQNFEIFVKDLQTGEETNLTQNEAYDSNPHWSPSGNWIVFASDRNGASDLYVIRSDGTDLRQLTTASRSIGYGRPSFTSDGTRIVANRFVRGVTDMIIIDFTGEEGL